MEPTIDTSLLAAGQDKALNQNPALQVDLDIYRPSFEDEDISEADKEALLQGLWSIAVLFAKMGFDLHPLQHVIDAQIPCGQDCEGSPAIPLSLSDLVKSEGDGLHTAFDLVSNHAGEEAGP